MHGSSFRSRNFVTKDFLKPNDTVNKQNIILYYPLLLNNCECSMSDLSMEL